MSFPNTFPIIHDDYHAERIGKLPDGTQFFVTTPFRPESKDIPGAEYLAVFLFESNGTFREARIDNLGSRAEMDKESAQVLLGQRMSELVGAKFCDIAKFRTWYSVSIVDGVYKCVYKVHDEPHR